MRGILLFGVFQNGLERFQIPMYVCDDGVFHFLTDNLKTLKCILRFIPRDGFIADKMFHISANGSQERFEFLACPFGDQFNAAVGQISHSSGNFKARGGGFCHIAKSNTLNPSRIKSFRAATVSGFRLVRHGAHKAKGGGAMQCFIGTLQKNHSFFLELSLTGEKISGSQHGLPLNRKTSGHFLSAARARC
jgi:hypothetical protein